MKTRTTTLALAFGLAWGLVIGLCGSVPAEQIWSLGVKDGSYREFAGAGDLAAGSKFASGAVVVTGGVGGLGSVAISLLSNYGYQVVASTGRPVEADYLKSLGASEVIDRSELTGKVKPLAKERFAGGIDSVGSTTLANVLSMTRYGGAVAACGLAGGMDLQTTVAPFILRGVSLLGIDSVYCPQPLRREAWRRLALDLDRAKLKAMTTVVPFADVIEVAGTIVEGKLRGRHAVRITES